jgi:hypothetical protein
MKIKIALGVMCLLFSFYSCSQKEKNYTKEELVIVIQDDILYQDVVKDKKAFLDNIVTGKWKIDIEKIDSVILKTANADDINELKRIYDSYKVPPDFTILSNKIAGKILVIEKKYRTSRFQGLMLDLQKESLKKMNIDYSKTFENGFSKQALHNYLHCDKQNVDICRKNWGKLAKVATEQLWGTIGNCNISMPSDTKHKKNLKNQQMMECHLTAIKFYIQDRDAAIQSLKGCYNIIGCEVL